MLTFAWLLLVVTEVAIVKACRTKPPAAGVSWFAILPYMQVSKKKRGRGEYRR